ncbi:hypothetical protein LJC49_08110 [Ruminococcaceae bacterium OttesenSCG-928-I18]|nr:hypothetical protein [Ruminococcaceae bacterium OttesenSCG-928-I18]
MQGGYWLEFLFGTGLVGGVLLFTFKLLVDRAVKRLDERRAREKEAEAKRRQRQREYRRREAVLSEKKERALGRYLYWIARGAVAFEKNEQKGYWNGEVEQAKQRFEQAEGELKDLQQEWMAGRYEE